MRLLEILFPPELPKFNPKDLEDSHTWDYQYRISRRGMDHSPKAAVGRVLKPAEPRRVFYMPARQW